MGRAGSSFRWAGPWSAPRHRDPARCLRSGRFLRHDAADSWQQQYLEWIGLLRCCTAFEAYCNVYTADLTQRRFSISAAQSGLSPLGALFDRRPSRGLSMVCAAGERPLDCGRTQPVAGQSAGFAQFLPKSPRYSPRTFGSICPEYLAAVPLIHDADLRGSTSTIRCRRRCHI